MEFTSHEEWMDYRHDLFETEWPKIESEIRTMARKVFLPGFTLDDMMQEFQLECWNATQWHDPDKASFKTLVWQRCFHVRDKLIQKFNTGKRDHTKEAHVPTENLDWNVDEFGQITRERLGNAGKYFQILNLETCDQIEKCVLFCLSVGHNINQTVEQVARDIDPEFGHKEFYKVRNSLQNNAEVQELMRSGR